MARKIDAGNELKNLEKKLNESANDYIARAQEISTKCQALGLNITDHELVFYTVRGLKGKFSIVWDILKTQHDKSIDEVLKILQEEESTSTACSEETPAKVRDCITFAEVQIM